MNASKNIFQLTQLMVRQTARNASTQTTVPSARYGGMKARQTILGAENDLQVHLKTGFLDRAMFLATALMIGGGSIAGLHAFYVCLFRK